MILGLLTLAVLTVIAVLIVREIRQLLYVRDVRRMPILTELQARQNAAPLTSAIADRHVADE